MVNSTQLNISSSNEKMGTLRNHEGDGNEEVKNNKFDKQYNKSGGA